MATYVALLRGINVGGARKISMRDLASLLAELGLEDVVTYIQSGNVVFRAPSGGPALAARIEEAIEAATGHDVSVLLRTPTELTRLVTANPYLSGDAAGSKLHVVFLDRKPANAAAAKLDPDRSPPDELSLHGTEIYLRFPNGSGKTKLTLDYFERTLGVRATARNWNTVLKLLELARG